MEQTQAASSPAEIEDVFKGEQVSLSEFTRYREDGEVPQRFKPQAESAPAASPEQTADDPVPDSDPGEVQEQPRPSSAAEKRIKQLLGQNKELQRKLEATQTPNPGSSPAQTAKPPQNFDEWFASFDDAKWSADYAKAHPNATYERLTTALNMYVAGARDHFQSIQQRNDAQKQALEAKVNEAKDRYEDFDEIKSTFMSNMISDKGAPLIPTQVLSIINDSDHITDLIYTIGSDEAELAKFVAMAKSNPNKAIRYVAKVESLIAEELAKPKEEKPAPEKRQTTAPKPPSPVGGSSSRGFDVSDESLSADEWARKRTADLKKRGK